MSLLTGKAGVITFNFFYLKYFGINGEKKFQKDIQLVAENSFNYKHPTFCTGKPGINWFFTFLYKNQIIDEEDWNFICSDDEYFAEFSLNTLKKGNYDFLHGAIGIAYYFLYAKPQFSSSFFSQFFFILNSLIENSVNKSTIPAYNHETDQVIANQVNLGLSHGIPSILKFSLQCYKQNICPDQAKQLYRNISNFLVANVNKDHTHCYFPFSIDFNDSRAIKNRLAWCYGDLSLAYILYQAGVVYSDKKIIDFSLEILRNCTQKKDYIDTLVMDGGLCHGSAGVAHIYNRLWVSTNEYIFKEATNFWIHKTIDFANMYGGQYKKYVLTTKEYNSEPSLLEGAAGVGLVLLSYLSGDLSWDYCLMLND